MSTTITFNSNSLQTSSIVTAQIDEGFPEKNVAVHPLAHAHGSVIPYTNHPSRRIVVRGKLIGTGITNMDALEDTFKGYLNGIDKNLDIGKNGSTRRYIATVNSVSIDRPVGLAWANFGIEFICSNPFGMDTSATTAVTASGRTSGSYNDSYTWLGSAPLQFPIITITINSVTGGAGGTITVGNDSTGQQISVTADFEAGDELVIDCRIGSRSVKINGIDVDHDGAYPEFTPEAHDIAYGDDFTTRDFDYDVSYFKLHN